VGRLFLIDAVGAVALVGLWYFCLATYNHRRGTKALRWVEAACSHRGQVTQARWIGASRLQAHLRFAAHWFENAQVTIRPGASSAAHPMDVERLAQTKRDPDF